MARRVTTSLSVSTVMALTLLWAPGAAVATTATATISPGPLALVSAAPTVSRSTGADGAPTATVSQAIDVRDGTASGGAWKITLSSTADPTKLAATMATGQSSRAVLVTWSSTLPASGAVWIVSLVSGP
jgi:hypothetical protein